MSDINATDVSRVNWMRVIAGGALWAAVYNLVWGVAWFAFMRKEWLSAVAAIKQPLPWTSEVWAIWIVVTLPIGVAIVAYVASHAGSAAKTAVYAGVTLWLLMTLGMVGLAWQKSYSVRVITVDSIVNLVAMVSASLAVTWSHRQRSAPFAGGGPQNEVRVPDAQQ